VDEASPMVDARLKYGSRVNAIIPPLALKGPTITIRKFNKRVFGPEDLLRLGSANREMVDFLTVCVENRKNIIVAGGTGSGKTTLLNVLSNLIPKGERIVTIEDAAELKLNHGHLVSLEARPSNLEGKGTIAIRDLVRNSLRMRPDRIIVGECRGGETLDMLQAMNTGHDGSLTTVHANSPRDVISRLEVMTLLAGLDIPITAIREQVASAVDVIVQQMRLADGSRRITHIVEVTGIENNTVQLQELFRFERVGFDADGRVVGYFTGCDATPTFYEDLRSVGVNLDLSVFAPTVKREAADERRA
jgi:pilus assembly protein CpaF